ncbi:MAG: peptidyl-prolyl cis-trans isomerase [Geminicoccaceae bacterium]
MTSGLHNRINQIFREPLVRFFIIGALIYTGYAFAGGQVVVVDDGKRITVTAGEVTWLEDSWKRRWNRPPTEEELQGIVRQFLRERVLASEAAAIGLDQDDVVIRRRLAQKLEYLSQDLLGGGKPSDDELKAFFADNAKAYEVPALVTMTHVFFDPDKRGGQSLVEAETQKPILASLDVAPKQARDYGDPFMLQSYYPERSYAELSKLFGGGFVDTVSGLSVGEWHGPVLSGYGVHLVYLHYRQEARPAELAAVKDQVLLDWQDQRRAELSEDYISGLLESYDVSIEGETPGLKALERQVATP